MPSGIETEKIGVPVLHGGHAVVPCVGRPVASRVEEVQRLREDIVVDETSVDGKGAHEQDDIPAAAARSAKGAVRDAGMHSQEERSNDLSQIGLRPLPLSDDHPQRRHEDDEAVPDVAEHDCEQERERDHRKQTGVDLLVRCNTIRIHDRLETFGEFVRSDERRGRPVRPQLVQNRRDIGT